MSRGRSDGSQKKRVIAYACGVAIFIGFLYVYQGSIFGSQNVSSSALEYGSKSLKRLGASYLGTDDASDSKQEDSSPRIGQGDAEDDIVPKSFPVSVCASLYSSQISVYCFMDTPFWFSACTL